jgi:hypothetical protein
MDSELFWDQDGLSTASRLVQHGIRVSSAHGQDRFSTGSGWVQNLFRKGSAWDQDGFSMESRSTFKLVFTVKEKVKNGSC